MSLQLTPPASAQGEPVRRAWVRAAVVVAALGVVGALAGALWFSLWSPPSGVVMNGEWFPDPAAEGSRADFDGTAIYTLVAVGTGLLAGLVVTRFVRMAPLLSLVALVVGCLLASATMMLVGTQLGPTDPASLASGAADMTRLPGHLHVAGISPWIAFAFGGVLGQFLVSLLGPADR